MHKIITAGHCKISPTLLEEVIKDSPKCTGRTEFLLCVFAKFECHKQCYASESLGCSMYRMLSISNKQLNKYDKFGVVRR